MSQKLLCSDAFSFKVYNKSCMHSFVLHEITLEEVSNNISNIKPYSAPGMDGIPPKFVKLARCILSLYHTKLFNKCSINKQEIFLRDFEVPMLSQSQKLHLQNLLMNFVPFLCSPFFLNCLSKF